MDNNIFYVERLCFSSVIKKDCMLFLYDQEQTRICICTLTAIIPHGTGSLSIIRQEKDI